MGFFGTARKLMQQNIREYGMYIALFVIMIIFTITTNGTFISSRNIVNLVNQTGYIAVLAIGMTLIIIIRHIDLSVGFLAGFLGAIAALGMADSNVIAAGMNLPVYVVIPMTLTLGILAGLITAFLVAQMQIPSFVASLAGWLIYRGAILVVTEATGTIIINDDTFNAIGNGFIPDIPDIGILPGIHKLTLILGVVAIILMIFNEINDRKKKQTYNFETLPTEMFAIKLIFISAIIGAVT
ncbi:MAG: sugar ABC transporter permease, partial [Chloroflexi bacterium]|nr:sugar ABC transporter permease [Chloroflexota bacterium]